MDKIKKKTSIEFLIVVLAFSILFFNNQESKKMLYAKKALIPHVVIVGETMGTTYSISIRNISKDVIRRKNDIQKDIDSLLNIINNSMSTYIEDSEISRFNNNLAFEKMSISSHFSNVLMRAYYHYHLSGKKFDPTIAPLYDIWGFRGDRMLNEPTQAEIEETMSLIGMDKIAIENSGLRLFPKYYISKAKDKVSIDLSAIAKGYAVDIISEYLSHNGYDNHFVEIGGEIRTSSRGVLLPISEGKLNWAIGIQDPTSIDGSISTIYTTNKAIATSGNYVNTIEYLNTGSIKTHIIDPTTGYPLEVKDGSIASVTVIAPTCIDADALATTLMLLDIDEGIKLIEDISWAEAYVVYIKGSTLDTRKSSNFKIYQYNIEGRTMEGSF